MTPASPELRPPSPPRAHRPAGKWLILLLAWAVGLCVWTGYVVLLFIVFLRIFS